MTPPDLAEIWVYLSEKPLTGLTLTLCAYAAGDWLYEKTGRHPLLNPVPIAIALIAGLLWLTDVPYADYFEGAQFVHFLLGPATVALAVPLYQHLAELRKSGPALIVGILAGSITASGCAVGFAWLGGASTETLLSIAPKSVTAPIAMGIAEQLGGLPAWHWASRRTASAPPARFRSTPSPAPSPASPWASTVWRRRSCCR